MELEFICLLVSVFGIQSSNSKEYSDDDVYISNSTTTYDKIMTNCNLFGSKFDDENYPVQKLMINITKPGTYWIGANIGFKRNINPVGVLPGCNMNYNESLDECNKHCKGRKYFSYNEHSCTCSNDNMAIVGLARVKNCKDQKHGLCFDNNCVVYEREDMERVFMFWADKKSDVLNNDYLCDIYRYSKSFIEWIFTTHNCSAKLSFICAGDELQPYTINSSWLVADHMCSKKNQHLMQTPQILDKTFTEDKYWISLFRRQKISWGNDSPCRTPHAGCRLCLTRDGNFEAKKNYQNSKQTVCVAARIRANGSYHLETHFCNESFKALCHKLEHVNDTARRFPFFITLHLSVIVSGALIIITLAFLIAIISIKSFRRISIYKDKLKRVNERLPGTEFSTYTGIEVSNVDLNNLSYNELDASTSHRLAEFHEIEIDTRDDAMDYQGYLVPEQHYHTIPETEVHYTEAFIAENNAVN